MPRESLQQSSFTSGEIDPLLASREGFDDFYSSVEKAQNVLVQPTGGITRRPGLEHIDDLPTNPTYWRNNGENIYQLIKFSAREQEQYMTVLAHNGSDPVLKLYREDSGYVVTTLDGGDSSVALPYTADQIQDVDWTQKLDVLILLHEDHHPREVRRISTDTFEVNKLTISSYPQYDFDDNDSPAEQDEVQEINFHSNMDSGDIYDVSLEGEVSSEIDWSSKASNNAERIENELRRLPNTSSAGITVNATGNDVYEVTFGGPDGSFNWGNIIVTVLTGDGSVDVSTTTQGESGEEDSWSSTRGWPKHGTFYNQRLWFAGSRELPETVWGSNVGSFFNFDEGDAEADDAIQFTINSDQVSQITWVFHGRNLIFGTEQVEYYVPEGNLTPEDIRVESATRRGSELNVRPVQSDGALYYLQRGGHALRQFVFSFGEDSYKSTNVSLLASHLMKEPRDMSLRQSTRTDVSDLIFMVNDEGGSATALSLLRSEDVIAFSDLRTKGRFRNSRSMDFENYFIVERDIPEKSDLKDAWDEQAELPSNRKKMSTIRNGNNVHFIGGSESGGAVSGQFIYKIDEDNWANRTSLPQKRHSASGDYLKGNLYVGGGVDSGDNDSDVFWVSENNGKSWQEVQNLPSATSDHEIVESEDELFLFTPTSTYRYRPNFDDFVSLNAMPTEVTNYAVAENDGNVYIIGGENTSNTVVGTVQIYDVENDSWSTGTDIPTNRKNAVAKVAKISTGDEIWVMGGNDGNTTLATNEAYEINNDSWTSNATMPTSRDNASSFLESLKMHVVGGNDSGDLSTHERYGNLQPVYRLEKMNEDNLLDASERKTSGLTSTTIGGFDHLVGETVDVQADGFYKGEKTVNNSGEIEVDEIPDDFVEVGYDLIKPTVKLWWPTIKQGQTTATERKKRIVEIVLDLIETRGLSVNGNRLSFRKLGDNLLDEEIPMFEGNKTIDGVTGWQEKPQVEITQETPQPMTIRGVIQVVSF